MPKRTVMPGKPETITVNVSDRIADKLNELEGALAQRQAELQQQLTVFQNDIRSRMELVIGAYLEGKSVKFDFASDVIVRSENGKAILIHRNTLNAPPVSPATPPEEGKEGDTKT